MQTIDELLESHPAPWVYRDESVYDSDGNDMFFRCNYMATLASAVNRIHELKAKLDDRVAANDGLLGNVKRISAENERLKARVAELEHSLADKVIAWTGVRQAQSDAAEMHRHLNTREQRRFEVACASLVGQRTSLGRHASPDDISMLAIADADALLAELAKPQPPDVSARS